LRDTTTAASLLVEIMKQHLTTVPCTKLDALNKYKRFFPFIRDDTITAFESFEQLSSIFIDFNQLQGFSDEIVHELSSIQNPNLHQKLGVQALLNLLKVEEVKENTDSNIESRPAADTNRYVYLLTKDLFPEIVIVCSGSPLSVIIRKVKNKGLVDHVDKMERFLVHDCQIIEQVFEFDYPDDDVFENYQLVCSILPEFLQNLCLKSHDIVCKQLCLILKQAIRLPLDQIDDSWYLMYVDAMNSVKRVSVGAKASSQNKLKVFADQLCRIQNRFLNVEHNPKLLWQSLYNITNKLAEFIDEKVLMAVEEECRQHVKSEFVHSEKLFQYILRSDKATLLTMFNLDSYEVTDRGLVGVLYATMLMNPKLRNQFSYFFEYDKQLTAEFNEWFKRATGIRAFLTACNIYSNMCRNCITLFDIETDQILAEKLATL